jgi:tetratricopeptide (TPR) repeat protein
MKPTIIPGIKYIYPLPNTTLDGLDGRIRIQLSGTPIPILDNEIICSNESSLEYDEVGQGIYYVLRYNPDCSFGDEYARLLRDGYPHFISELASHTIMLGHKDVDECYLDRRINYLKVFSLLDADNAEFPLEIGITLMDKGLRISSLYNSTVTLYNAEKFLKKALSLAPENVKARYKLGEVCYLLGKYNDAKDLWSEILSDITGMDAEKMKESIDNISNGILTRIPIVDYLEVIAVAFYHHQAREYEDAVAIISDILEDSVFVDQFPLPELYYVLGLCYKSMHITSSAIQMLNHALTMKPEYTEAKNALESLDRGE